MVSSASDTHKNGKSAEHIYTFDEAIGLTGVGRFHYIVLLISGICFMTVMAETMGISMIMPMVKCDLGATQAEQGLLASTGFFGIVVSSHIMGFLADTWGRVRTLRYSLLLAAFATIISAFSVNIWMLLVFRFLNGFFISGCQACVFSLCGEFHSNKTRVRYVTLLAIFLPLALLYLPAIGLVILPLNIKFKIFGLTFVSWRAFLLFQILLSIFGLLGLFKIPETPKYMLVQGDHDGALEILRQIYSKNKGEHPDSFPVRRIALETGGASLSNVHGVNDAIKLVWNQTVPLFYKERVLHTINICFSLMVVYGISQGTLMWYPTILKEIVSKKDQRHKICSIIGDMEIKGADANNDCNGIVYAFIFQVLMMVGGFLTLIYLIFAYTIDLIGKVNLLMLWLLICCICSAVVEWTSEFAGSVVVLTFIVSIGNCGGIIGTIAMEFYPTQINAMGMCFVMMMGRLGAVAGGNIIGLLIFKYCGTLFWTFAGIMALLIALAAVLPQRKCVKTTTHI